MTTISQIQDGSLSQQSVDQIKLIKLAYHPMDEMSNRINEVKIKLCQHLIRLMPFAFIVLMPVLAQYTDIHTKCHLLIDVCDQLLYLQFNLLSLLGYSFQCFQKQHLNVLKSLYLTSDCITHSLQGSSMYCIHQCFIKYVLPYTQLHNYGIMYTFQNKIVQMHKLMHNQCMKLKHYCRLIV